MNEDYVSYELAIKLKACGFDEPCLTFYDANKELGRALDSDNFNHLGETYQGEWFSGTISTPTLAHAQKWLREKWGIHVDVCPYSDYSTDADGNVCDRWDFWGFDLYAVIGGEKMVDDDGEYDSYEQALSEGIASVLELIKE